ACPTGSVAAGPPPQPPAPFLPITFEVQSKSKADGVGKGKDTGHVEIGGEFTLPRAISLDHATLTLWRLLDEVGGIELAQRVAKVPFLPITLTARHGSKPDDATFETPPGQQPAVHVEVRTRPHQSTAMEFTITVDHAFIADPGFCSGGQKS